MRGGRLLFREILTLQCFIVLFGLCTSRPYERALPYLQEDGVGVLSCLANGGLSPEEVTWKKHINFTSNETLVTLDVDVAERRGLGYERGRFNITEDYSLEINPLRTEDSGKYFCEIKNNDEEIVFSNWTVSVSKRDVPAQNESSSCERKVQIYFRSLITVSLLAGIELIILIVAVKFYISRKSGPYCRFPTEDAPNTGPYSRFLTADALYTGRISYYELWELVQYAFEEKEDDKLEVAVGSLVNEKNIQSSTYGSTNKDLYQALCIWKKKCDDPVMNQIELLFEKCIAAGMVKSIRKLRDLRLTVSDVPGSTYNDLEHIVWQIGKESTGNITNLLENLKVTISVDSNSELKEIVDEALEKLEIWKEGLVPINPLVMLSLTLEALELSEGVDEFFQIPDEKKQPLSKKEIEKKVHAITERHFNKALDVVASQRKGKKVMKIPVVDDNETVLFKACEMIKDWLELQKCSNYEKRQELQEKLSARIPVTDGDLFTATVIKKKASEGKEKKVAEELLMTDILPIARSLGIEDSKLQKYKIEQFDRSHLAMGTIGLVTMLVD